MEFPPDERLLQVKRKIDALKDEIVLLNRKQSEAALMTAGLEFGAVVVSGNKKFRVRDVDYVSANEFGTLIWLKASPQKKDGTFSLHTKRLFHWEKI